MFPLLVMHNEPGECIGSGHWKTLYCPGSVTLIRHLPTSEPSVLLWGLAKITLNRGKHRDAQEQMAISKAFFSGGKSDKEWVLLLTKLVE